MTKKITIRNSTVDFLLFSTNDEQGIDVIYKNQDIWLSQKLMAELFGVGVSAINKHISNIFTEGELSEQVVVSKMEITTQHGAITDRTQVKKVNFYNLDMIIAVGYRINSTRATQFRQWATSILKDFAIKGYIIDKQRMENGNIFGEDYFKHLLAEIREIRLSERRFYQKVTDIFATSSDYNKNSPMSQNFFATVQNKLHYAIHQHTASELIVERADSTKQNMGLTSWKNNPDGKIVKTDVSVAKNYLSQKELESLAKIVNAYLDIAEDRAERQIPMTMEDWIEQLNKFLDLTDRDILQDAGKVQHHKAKIKAEAEFKKFRPIQDKLFESDFDKQTKKLTKKIKKQNK